MRVVTRKMLNVLLNDKFYKIYNIDDASLPLADTKDITEIQQPRLYVSGSLPDEGATGRNRQSASGMSSFDHWVTMFGIGSPSSPAALLFQWSSGYIKTRRTSLICPYKRSCASVQ